MKSTEQNDRLDTADGVKPAVKKRYVKPEVRHERVFETQALSCGKTSDTQSGCKSIRKSS